MSSFSLLEGFSILNNGLFALGDVELLQKKIISITKRYYIIISIPIKLNCISVPVSTIMHPHAKL